MKRSAVISADQAYRYRLDRVWAANAVQCTFIMLNPSTADGLEDDPTIRRCIGFAQREGCGRLAVVNLFAFRSTNPAILTRVHDPIGPENDDHIARALLETEGPVILGWGGGGPDFRVRQVERLFGGMRIFCLGFTQNGSPLHPLYIPKDQPLVPWRRIGSA